MTRAEAREEIRKEQDREIILSYLKDQNVDDLLDMIPALYSVDIEDALINIIMDYDLVYINRFNEICFPHSG